MKSLTKMGLPRFGTYGFLSAMLAAQMTLVASTTPTPAGKNSRTKYESKKR